MTHYIRNVGCSFFLAIADFISFVLSLYISLQLLSFSYLYVPTEQIEGWISLHWVLGVIGAFLRRTSLDELPQLFNVLKGEMSLVGPRPIIDEELERYNDEVEYYLLSKPGMTGLWQVSGRSDVDYETRVYLDTWYVKNWSMWNDLVILFKTVNVVLRRDGAY